MTAPVSVIIPCYNAAGFVADAVRSVRGQTSVPAQTIVVNDGSPDGQALHEALRPFRGFIDVVEQENKGLSGARNAGLRLASSEYVAFLDADDWWDPRFVELQVEALQRGGLDVVYCDAFLVGKSSKTGQTVMSLSPSAGDVTLEALLAERCVPILSASVCRRVLTSAVGGFRERLRRVEDFDLWVRLLQAGARFGYHTRPLVYRRLHDASLSADQLAMLAAGQEVLREILAREGLSPAERAAALATMRRMEAAIRVARAKTALLDGRVAEARNEAHAAVLAGASPTFREFSRLLDISPTLARALLRSVARIRQSKTGGHP